MKSDKAFGQLPAALRKELLDSFNEIVKNFRENRWEPSELNGGKLCEVVFTILKGRIDGIYAGRSFKPANMVDACNQLASSPSQISRSIRIQLPRMLIALYEVRNNRGVGHVGGEVDPNHMDASVVLSISKWIMAELVRIFHDVDTKTATDVVELLIERELPIIWQVNGKKRVLKSGLTMKEKTLLLLYSEPSADVNELISWVEHSNASLYRRDILTRGHKAMLWEYNKDTQLVILSPLGSRYVEQNLL
jgi:hypothetical protein